MNHRVSWAQECIRSKNIHHEEHACMGRGGSVSGPKDVILAAHWLPGATVVLCAGAPLSWMPQLLWPPDSADPLPFSNQVTSFLPMASSSRAMTSRSMKARSQGSLTRCASLWIRTPCCCQVSCNSQCPCGQSPPTTGRLVWSLALGSMAGSAPCVQTTPFPSKPTLCLPCRAMAWPGNSHSKHQSVSPLQDTASVLSSF